MKTRFLHFADCHLGYKQYNLIERFDDFARAFIYVIDQAIAEKVDFVILAGDLFQKRAIDAFTLQQALVGLEKLRRAEIPCIAIEGNHELAYHTDTLGWVRFLGERRLITLLDADFTEGRPMLEMHDGRDGSFIDIVPGVRIYGLGYRGAGTAKAIEGYADALAQADHEQIEYTIFVAHTGVEGVLSGHSGGLSHRQLSVLKPHVDYLALGHIHKPFTFDEWVYNPGSPENCSMTEVAWRDRGYYLVDVDTDSRDGKKAKHSATLYPVPRRPFHRLSMKVDLHTSPDALYEHCRGYLKRKARDLSRSISDQTAPVVELQLTGVLPFDRTDLDVNHISQMITAEFEPLYIQVRNLTRSADFAVEYAEGLSRPALERQVIAELFERDARFLSHSRDWTELTLMLKTLALTESSTEAILNELTDHLSRLDPLPTEALDRDPSDNQPKSEQLALLEG